MVSILTKYIDINLVRHNLEVAKEESGSEIMAVVKANCYNNGSLTARYIEDYVCAFAVATVLEGVNLRKLGITKPILALSFNKNEAELCKKYNISASLSDVRNYVQGVRYHIAIDSGMNRAGVKGLAELKSLLSVIDHKDIEGIYSHIYSQNDVLTCSQISNFEEAIHLTKKYHSQIKTHIFATNYKLNANKYHADMVRLGIGLYDSAVAVTSKVLQIKSVKKGECIGYDGEFCAPKDMSVALCEGGYFDGIIRRFCGQKIAISTDFCKVIGKISMDSHIIDITDKRVSVGDTTIIYDTNELSFAERAADMNISAYELMTALKGRFEYVYFI